MEKLTSKFSNFSLHRVKTFFHSVAGKKFSPHQQWRIALFVGAIAAAGISAAAFFALGWASARAVIVEVSPPEERPLSIAQMRDVIEFYQQKTERFESLKRKAPLAPDLGRGQSAQPASESSKATSLELEVGNTPPQLVP